MGWPGAIRSLQEVKNANNATDEEDGQKAVFDASGTVVFGRGYRAHWKIRVIDSKGCFDRRQAVVKGNTG